MTHHIWTHRSSVTLCCFFIVRVFDTVVSGARKDTVVVPEFFWNPLCRLQHSGRCRGNVTLDRSECAVVMHTFDKVLFYLLFFLLYVVMWNMIITKINNYKKNVRDIQRHVKEVKNSIWAITVQQYCWNKKGTIKDESRQLCRGSTVYSRQYISLLIMTEKLFKSRYLFSVLQATDCSVWLGVSKLPSMVFALCLTELPVKKARHADGTINLSNTYDKK